MQHNSLIISIWATGFEPAAPYPQRIVQINQQWPEALSLYWLQYFFEGIQLQKRHFKRSVDNSQVKNENLQDTLLLAGRIIDDFRR